MSATDGGLVWTGRCPCCVSLSVVICAAAPSPITRVFTLQVRVKGECDFMRIVSVRSKTLRATVGGVSVRVGFI